LQKFKDWLVNDQSQTVAVLDEHFLHALILPKV
jgi:hypothetical protein